MTQLHSETDAIRLAVEAGYALHGVPFSTEEQTSDFRAVIFQDPAFWTALGKARGWKKVICRGCETELDESDPRKYPQKNCGCYENYEEVKTWLYHALRYFEVRLNQGDLGAYWSSLP